MQNYQGADKDLLTDYLAAHQDMASFRDDCALLAPVAEGAGVIFVVDGSRPLRHADRAEMEILRLSGAPRMAVINSKEDDSSFLEQWQTAFRKHFNSIRKFNSTRATYVQRIDLLESLKYIDQQWEPALKKTVEAFKIDWQARNESVAELMLSLLAEVLSYTKTVSCSREKEETCRQQLWQQFKNFAEKKEQGTHKAIRRLFKHNIFSLELPSQSLLHEDLFSSKTWEFLGLTGRQVILAGAVSGAAVGAGLDVAAAGITFGVFSSIGGLVGGLATAIKGRKWLTDMRIMGIRLGGDQLVIGPVTNIQLMYVLLDRTFLFYRHTINWAHGKREYPDGPLPLAEGNGKESFSASWSRDEHKVCELFFQGIRQKNENKAQEQAQAAMRSFLKAKLLQISTDG